MPSFSETPMEDTGVEVLAAPEEYSFCRVEGPATPSSHRPDLSWKAMTAAWVAPPNSPSAWPPIQPSSISRFCRVVTFLPLEPTCR